ncbi:SIS domain-containing protein [Mediterraneibacter gnavus]|uniref:SIS domain-containing protein n=1 Tax=Mediterraneibacter gnavus TaxID=33038 RepID=UPI00232F84DD|nr:SIS domain-containing protein [Mediterraneibacter gnavus]MDB8710067.1 SIS domain-containing protein [Mediterraneibacter gnavus]MDB8713464.1 SIS domain-containing protein [Mediterraneibacter gnavus]
MDNILKNKEQYLKELKNIISEQCVDELIFIGSGTSNTAAVTAAPFVEKVSGLRTTVVTANEFMYDRYVRNKNALYVFTSQTGTSHFVREAQKQIREKGYLTAAISESRDTPLAKESVVFINMGSGEEDCPMRTIGYCASVLIHMLMGLEIGKKYGKISEEEYRVYIKEAERLPESNEAIRKAALAWMDRARRKMFQSQLIVFTGAGSLYGLALEGAMKVWECPQIASVGYELEEGMHGPNYGYNNNHCVIFLNDGREERKGLALAKWMKEIHKNGFVIGNNGVDSADLQFNLQTVHFTAIEMSAAVQVIAYRLAEDGGRDLLAPHDNRVMERYFKTHD